MPAWSSPVVSRFVLAICFSKVLSDWGISKVHRLPFIARLDPPFSGLRFVPPRSSNILLLAVHGALCFRLPISSGLAFFSQPEEEAAFASD